MLSFQIAYVHVHKRIYIYAIPHLLIRLHTHTHTHTHTHVLCAQGDPSNDNLYVVLTGTLRALIERVKMDDCSLNRIMYH